MNKRKYYFNTARCSCALHALLLIYLAKSSRRRGPISFSNLLSMYIFLVEPIFDQDGVTWFLFTVFQALKVKNNLLNTPHQDLELFFFSRHLVSFSLATC